MIVLEDSTPAEEEKKRSIARMRMQQAEDKALDLRQRADYRDLPNITQEQVEPYFEQTRKFIDTVGALLKASKGV